jgi:hypothetical protein
LLSNEINLEACLLRLRLRLRHDGVCDLSLLLLVKPATTMRLNIHDLAAAARLTWPSFRGRT